MPEGDNTNTESAEQEPETGKGAEQQGKQQQSADEGKGGKDAILADLAKERDKRQELEKQIEALKSSTISRDDLAKALGVAPEETSDADKLAEQLASITSRIDAAEKRAALLESAAEKGIPKEYLGLWEAAGGSDALQQQVLDLVAAKAAKDETPGFVSSNGQGQGDGKTPTLTEQLAAAEQELAGKATGSPEFRVAQQKVMTLKSQQLFAAHQTTK